MCTAYTFLVKSLVSTTQSVSIPCVFLCIRLSFGYAVSASLCLSLPLSPLSCLSPSLLLVSLLCLSRKSVVCYSRDSLCLCLCLCLCLSVCLSLCLHLLSLI